MVVEVKEGAAAVRTRWQRDIRSPKAGIAYICQNNLFTDVTIVVGRRKFTGHRLILMARSEKLMKMLKDKAPGSMEEIRINDVGEEAFDILFNYIYTNKFREMEPRELVLEVHRAATIYGQRGLREACEAIIAKWEISHDTVISVLQMSDVQFVKERCWEHLKQNTRAVLASDGLLEASSDTLCEIFEKGYFNGVPVMDLLTNIVRWAANLFPHQPDFERVREHLLVPNGDQQRCLMSWIGFQRLTLDQLAVVVNKYPKLINDSEFRVFFQYLTAEENNRPALPIWIEG